jgi:hypothetical protein
MLVTKWVCLVETIVDDGTRALYVSASDGLTACDTAGMLEYGLAPERAAIGADLLTAADGDD